jgi:SAM-dependent methyltransferase
LSVCVQLRLEIPTPLTPTNLRDLELINNTDEYVALMRRRAAGDLPDMGCALRVAEIIAGAWPDDRGRGMRLLDVGCATGHFRRTFGGKGLPIDRYVGLEIDPAMVRAGSEVWKAQIETGAVQFINADLEVFEPEQAFDVVICVNAFMYFASAKRALGNLLKAAAGGRLFVRSYFMDVNYRIIRAQTSLNHDKSPWSELDVFDEEGEMRCYDFWNIYSQTYIEQLVGLLAPGSRVSWLEDRNVRSSLEQERELSLQKRGATEVLNDYEVSYPFILPWKYLAVDLTGTAAGAETR